MLNPTGKKKLLAVAASLTLWVLLALLDFSVGLKVRFGPAYAIPVLLYTWYLGPAPGVLSALVSTVLWHGMQVVVLQDQSITFYRNWDLLSGLLAFLGVALTTSWSRGLYARETELNLELKRALEQVETLEGMLPICAWCRRVRDEEGLWEQIETYVSKHSDTTWTHGICPECMGQLADKGST